MDRCCSPGDLAAIAQRKEHRRVLRVVLAINASLFVLELWAGVLARSTSLLADSLDMLGDSLVYGFSLYVLARSAQARARASVLKGIIMAAFGVFVLVEAGFKMLAPVTPVAGVMGAVGLIALAGNGACFWLLYRHRADDLNMRSTWICSRNDLVANVSVLVAAAGVAVTGTVWPDVAVGLAIAILFLQSAANVLRESSAHLRELRAV